MCTQRIHDAMQLLIIFTARAERLQHRQQFFMMCMIIFFQRGRPGFLLHRSLRSFRKNIRSRCRIKTDHAVIFPDDGETVAVNRRDAGILQFHQLLIQICILFRIRFLLCLFVQPCRKPLLHLGSRRRCERQGKDSRKGNMIFRAPLQKPCNQNTGLSGTGTGRDQDTGTSRGNRFRLLFIKRHLSHSPFRSSAPYPA